MSPSPKVAVDVDGRALTLSNLDKVLFPEVGFTKGQVLDYYTRVAPVLLPHLAGRPVTFTRWPDGVTGHSFYEKNAPRHAPEWLRRVRLPSPGSTKSRENIDYAVVEDLASLVWAANLAALELHVPQWRVDADGQPAGADTLVIDLDPGPPATVVECCAVALRVRERLEADGLHPLPKTSGSKGLQLYAAVERTDPERVWAYARQLAQTLAAEQPDEVVWRMEKALRPGKVLLDWSQNSAAKTTVAPYSLRARPAPTASTPVTWDEVAACRSPEDLRFTADDVLARVADHGDLLAARLEPGPPLPD